MLLSEFLLKNDDIESLRAYDAYGFEFIVVSHPFLTEIKTNAGKVKRYMIDIVYTGNRVYTEGFLSTPMKDPLPLQKHLRRTVETNVWVDFVLYNKLLGITNGGNTYKTEFEVLLKIDM